MLPKRSPRIRLRRRQTRNKDRPTDNSDADGSGPQVSRIRTWNADTYTRIVIDVGSKVKYQAARISGPDRIYFDIEGAKVSSALLHKPIDLDSGGFLKTVRVAQNQSGVVRVVLEVNRVTDYSVFLLPDPYRLVVDVYGTSAAAEAAARDTAPPPGPTTTDAPPVKPEKPAKETAAKASPKATEKAAAKSASDHSSTDASAAQAQTQVCVRLLGNSADASADAEPAPRKTSSNPGKNSQKTAGAASTKTGNDAQDERNRGLRRCRQRQRLRTRRYCPSPAHPVSPKKSSRATKSAHDQAEEMGPPPTPELTRDGQHSLTRALGLKIGRIVIDAGHGGHDTGTIGPTGLMEKDLCLDVALRLGKIIQQRLPSAEVVFTRDDDTFIPLERRTEIANEAKADLFISVHANSSQDHRRAGSKRIT